MMNHRYSTETTKKLSKITFGIHREIANNLLNRKTQNLGIRCSCWGV